MDLKEIKEEIPTLEEILEILKPSDLLINVEIKDSNPDSIPICLDLILKMEIPLSRIFFSSFTHFHQRYLRLATEKRGLPNQPFGYLTMDVYDLDFDLIEKNFIKGDAFITNWKTIEDHYGDLVDEFARLKDIGVEFGMWFSFTHPEDKGKYEYLKSIGWDFMITNCPSLADELNSVE